MQSVTNFKDRDGSCPNGCARLLVEPFDNTRVRRVPHERRENVGIENDHRSKRAGLVWYPRSSGMSSSSPITRAENRRIWVQLGCNKSGFVAFSIAVLSCPETGVHSTGRCNTI